MDVLRHTWQSPASNLASHTVTLPVDVLAGDLLVCIYACDGGPTSISPSAGWVNLGKLAQASNVSGAVFFRKATGDDALVVTTSAAEITSAVVYRIRGADYADCVFSSTTAADAASPAFTPVSLGLSYLYITALCVDATGVATAPPAGYENLTTVAHASSSGASTSAADRISSDATTPAGNWTIAGTAGKISTTIAVYLVPKFQGVVTDDTGSPAARQVSAHRMTTTALPVLSGGRTALPVLSDPVDGAYLIECPDNTAEYFLVALSASEALPSLISDRKVPS